MLHVFLPADSILVEKLVNLRLALGEQHLPQVHGSQRVEVLAMKKQNKLNALRSGLHYLHCI